jgi:hypothetical protein
MKRFAVIALALLVCWPTAALAAKTTYIATDHRFNYVKLKEVKSSVAVERNMTHPKDLDTLGLKEALKSVKLSRSYVIKKEVDTQRVFDDTSIDFLAPNLAKAFAQANEREEVIFSYLSKNPHFILRNDRINLGKMWVSGNELHIRFSKLYAKVTGDIDKRGNEAKAIARSRGLRISLELGPGQQLAINDPEELVLNLNYNYAETPKEAKPLPTTTRTMSGDIVPVPGVGTAADTKTTTAAEGGAMASGSKPAATGTTTTTATTASTAETGGSVKERLQSLETLKKEGLITDKEYKQKRIEILGDL